MADEDNVVEGTVDAAGEVVHEAAAAVEAVEQAAVETAAGVTEVPSAALDALTGAVRDLTDRVVALEGAAGDVVEEGSAAVEDVVPGAEAPNPAGERRGGFMAEIHRVAG
jgi:hypothetical protein